MAAEESIEVKESIEEKVADTNSSENQKLPDDLITEIMLHSDLRSVHRCKCVSRDSNRILSDPSFRLNYISLREKSVDNSPPPLLLGFFHFKSKRQVVDPEVERPPQFSFLPTNLEGEPIYSLEFFNKINRGHFQCVSNGLVLCGDVPNLHVFNPITRKILSLPTANFRSPDGLNYRPASPGFISSQFDNDFKVVVPFYAPIRENGFEKVLVNIYSSKTRLWTDSEFIAVAHFKISPCELSLSINETCFWFTAGDYILAYNPIRDEKLVQMIKRPPVVNTFQTPSLCQSRSGFLHCAVDDYGLPGFRVYVLTKTLESYGHEAVVDQKEWVLTHSVQLDTLDAITSLRNHFPVNPYLLKHAVGARFHPMNPRILYLKMGDRIISWDVEKSKLLPVPYRGYMYSGSDYYMLSLCPYVQLPWPPSPCAIIP